MQYNENSDHIGRLQQLRIAVRGIHNRQHVYLVRPTVFSQLEFCPSFSTPLWCSTLH